jgi:hypothetical protein
MKYYETHYEEYIQSANKFNIHPEWNVIHDNLPKNIHDIGNIIVYGPSGVGKYTQSLKIIQKYSPSGLKYDKKINVQTEKQTYLCRISDTHYEVDMSLLGCNSKILWHEIFSQVVDIVSVKQNKMGFILCKNFHHIHSELLEIFYSYIQQYNHPQCAIQIRFIILTEHISFIPNNMLNSCQILSVKRPSKDTYAKLALMNKNDSSVSSNSNFLTRISHIHNKRPLPQSPHSIMVPSSQKLCSDDTLLSVMDSIDPECITNMKEFRSFSLLNNDLVIPEDIFNIVCNNIIREMENYQKIVFTQFRDTIYDMLIYNLDISECIWTIIIHFIYNNSLTADSITRVLIKTHLFFKYFNNNYRPIYHLESMLFYIINQGFEFK